MIREANENDLKDILEIYNDAILNTTAVYDYQAHTLEQRKLWYQMKLEENFPVLVYEEDNKVIGFATFGSFRARPAYKYTVENSVYIHNEYRKKGIGELLMNQIIKVAEERDYKTLIAAIDETNEASIKLHIKLGFKYVGTIKKAGYKFNKWLDLSFYQYELSGPKNPIGE